MSDISDWGIEAQDQTVDQLPPTMPDYGWLVEIESCDKDSDPQGKERSLLIGCRISAANSRWDGHLGFVRFFLGGKNPDAAVKRVGKFIGALGFEKGQLIKHTDEIVGRMCILGMDIAPKKPDYTRPRQWWVNDGANQSHVATDTLPTWKAKPNGKGVSK